MGLRGVYYRQIRSTYLLSSLQVLSSYSILMFITQLPENITNGTVRAETIAIHHETNCVRHDTGSVSGLYPTDVFPNSSYYDVS